MYLAFWLVCAILCSVRCISSFSFVHGFADNRVSDWSIFNGSFYDTAYSHHHLSIPSKGIIQFP
jgi:hypothetical protein